MNIEIDFALLLQEVPLVVSPKVAAVRPLAPAIVEVEPVTEEMAVAV